MSALDMAQADRRPVGGLERIESPVPVGPRLDRPRSAAVAAKDGVIEFAISGDLDARLAVVTGHAPQLQFTAVAAALVAALHRMTGAARIAIGCPTGRAQEPDATMIVADVEPNLSFRQLLLDLRQATAALDERPLPVSEALARLDGARPANRCPIFDVALGFAELHHDMPDLGHDLTLTLARQGDGLAGRAHFACALFSPATIEDFVRRVLAVLRSGLADPATALGDLDLLADDECQALAHWNATARDFPRDRCVHQAFEDQAARRPDATALVFGPRRLTYRELDARANRLANELRARGIGADRLVGICLNRSPDLVIAVLAVLKAGGAYVPYDPAYPRQRLATMLSGIELKVLLTSQDLLERLPPVRAAVLCLDRDAATIARRDAAKPPEAAAPSSLCYAIFTSGSTGQAKLTAVHHRGWMNLMHWFVAEFALTPEDRTLVMSSFSFDITQRSMAMPLISGGELHLIESDGYEPDLIVHTIRDHAITAMNCAPSTFYPLIENSHDWPSLATLRRLFLGGEAISASRLKAWATSGDCRAEIANVYGAAECSDVSSFHRLHDYDRYIETSVPIGRPISNTQVYVLDERGKPLPPGVQGEICLAGEGVGRGYLNDPALTARKFVRDPAGADPEAKRYRTGDLGRLRADGVLEFAGRVDHQVKIRGQRIELGDIEAALRQDAEVKEAVVVDWEKSPGDRRLTAYVVPQRACAAAAEFGEARRTALAAKLPSYMIPNHFIVLANLPLSPNGKVDRAALPPPHGGNEPAGAPTAGAGTTEDLVGHIFAEVLEVPQVAPTASFFSLGGHSLLATRVIAKIAEAFKVQLPRLDFYALPTVAGVAKKIDERLAASRGS